MSVLLSAYYPEGIVFAADKNATVTNLISGSRHVESTATKVLAWPFQRAVVGFVGLGGLAGLTTDEWMRIFIAHTRDCEDIDEIAKQLRDRIQQDFDDEYSLSSNVSQRHLIIHLGGYAIRAGVATPVLYHIWNHGPVDPQSGYPTATRDFQIGEDIERDFRSQTGSNRYPSDVQNWLQNKISQGQFQWYNNGANLAAFNTFKGVLWQSVRVLQQAGFVPQSQGLDQRIAFCKMAVEVFGSFFTHYYAPEDRAVGGGVDVQYIPCP